MINNKDVIELVWGKKHDFPFRHSAILVKFDDEEEIVIDFSALNPNESSASRSVTYVKATTHLALPDHFKPIEGDIRIYSFSQTMSFAVLGSTLKFNIDNTINKKRASDLIIDLLRIKMGPYHAKTNNCRHFIKRAFEILEKEHKCAAEIREKFENNITALENDDDKTVEAVKLAAGIGLDVFATAGTLGILAAQNVSVDTRTFSISYNENNNESDDETDNEETADEPENESDDE